MVVNYLHKLVLKRQQSTTAEAATLNLNVIWLNAETKKSLRKSVINLASELKINLKIKDKTLVKQVYEGFSSNEDLKTIFVFDNTEDFSLLQKHLPEGLLPTCYQRIKIIIISRTFHPNFPSNKIQLVEFTLEEAVEFIRYNMINSREAADINDIQELAIKVDKFPLALQQVIFYLNEAYTLNSNENRIQQYLAKFDENSIQMKKFQKSVYNKTMFTVWITTYEKMRNEDKSGNADKILRALALMNETSVSRDELKERRHCYSPLFCCSYCSKTPYSEEDLALLERHSLIRIQENDNTIHIHQVNQQIANVYLHTRSHFHIYLIILIWFTVSLIFNISTFVFGQGTHGLLITAAVNIAGVTYSIYKKWSTIRLLPNKLCSFCYCCK